MAKRQLETTKPPHERLADYRASKKWGLREMAGALNCSPTHLMEIERGVRTPDAYRIRRAAQQLVGIGLDDWETKR